MNMFDEANAIRTMLDMRQITRKELSTSLGLSESCIANKLRLLRLSDKIQAAVIQGGLTERHARLLLRLDDADSQLSLVNEIADRHLTVAEAEACLELRYIKNINASAINKNPCPPEARDSFVDNVFKGVRSLVSLGISAKATISRYEKKSYITIVIED